MKTFYKIDSYATKLLKCLLCALPVCLIQYGVFTWLKLGAFIVVFAIAWKKIKLTKGLYELDKEDSED